MKLIGITGGIATGKSTVSRILQEHYDVPVIYVDRLSRTVVEPGTPALDKLVEEFGVEILLPTGYLNRPALRKITIHDGSKMDIVTGIVWPEIAKQIQRMMTNFESIGVRAVCIENAIMIETGNYDLYDEIVVVTCDSDIQMKRVMSRDNQSEEDAQAMINRQMPLEDKAKFATFLITNNGELPELRAQVDALYEEKIK